MGGQEASGSLRNGGSNIGGQSRSGSPSTTIDMSLKIFGGWGTIHGSGVLHGFPASSARQDNLICCPAEGRQGH